MNTYLVVISSVRDVMVCGELHVCVLCVNFALEVNHLDGSDSALVAFVAHLASGAVFSLLHVERGDESIYHRHIL